MKIYRIQDLELEENPEILLRCDFNVPLKDGEIIDARRIEEALPTISYLLEKEVRLVICSHLGRPQGKEEKYSLLPVKNFLKNFFPSIYFIEDCIGDSVLEARSSLQKGEVLLLENTRFYEEEIQNDIIFSKNLAGKASYFVNDAFGSSHRAHASVLGVCDFVKKSVAGFLLQKELHYLYNILEDPEPPFLAILGGSKISDKIEIIQSLIGKADCLIIGGAMANTFHAALGYEIGASLFEKEKLEMAFNFFTLAKKSKTKLLLPEDVVIGNELSESSETRELLPYSLGGKVEENWMALDIGSQSIKVFIEEIRKAKTILWNGPMGVFEISHFENGTLALAREMAKSKGLTIVGGGDSISAIQKFGLREKMDFISTGGGATLEILGGKTLPGVLNLIY